MGTPTVVFTDLDGTLLDGRTYSPAAAREAVRALVRRAIPVVFCSSKTAAEQRPLRAELNLEAMPFIAENGSAIYVPVVSELPPAEGFALSATGTEWVRVLGLSAAVVRERIQRVAAAAGVPLTGYASLSTARLATLASLDPAAADRAKQREFSETLIDQHPPHVWERLEQAFAAEGLVCRHGGRFRTVTGAASDKGRAVRIVAALYARKHGTAVTTVGLGDSANDVPMLAAVTRAYLVAREDGTWACVTLAGLRRVAQPGPLGWSTAVAEVLAQA